MDIEKLIEQLRDKGCEDCPHRDTCRDDDTAECVIRLNAATAFSTLQAENEKLRDELEQVKAERDAAIEYLREIEWCAGCKHFGGLDGCKKWAMGQCTEKHDLYEFVGPKKED